MSTALRPVLRPSTLPSLPSASSTTTYICQSCRHARLLKRPKRPYTFTQLVTLSDGSAFFQRTSSPIPIYRSTRDTRNAPLWNPSTKELLNVEDDEAGRLAGFRARFGSSFDARKIVEGVNGEGVGELMDLQAQGKADVSQSPRDGSGKTGSVEGEVQETQGSRKEQPAQQKQTPVEEEESDGWDFGEEDSSLLDLISSFGQEDIKVKDVLPTKKGGKK